MLKINLKKIRSSKKMTQKELAAIIEVSQNYLSELENGKKVPSFKTLSKICSSLKICPRDLLSCDCCDCSKAQKKQL